MNTNDIIGAVRDKAIQLANPPKKTVRPRANAKASRPSSARAQARTKARAHVSRSESGVESDERAAARVRLQGRLADRNEQRHQDKIRKVMLGAAGAFLILATATAIAATAFSGAAEATSDYAESADVAATPAAEEEVRDLKNVDAPLLQFAQSGEPWSDLPYWGGTISMNGCGLCAYTTMVDILVGTDYTPEDMLYIRGDWEGMDGWVDDNTGSGELTHHDWTLETFGIDSWRIDVNSESLKEAVSRGDSVAMLCAGNPEDYIFLGTAGDEHQYDGHFILVWDYDENGNFHVHDSAVSHGYGCDVIYTPEEMSELIGNTSSIVEYRAVY